MLATYGVDVLDPRVTLRRIWVLARRLPAGAWPDRSTAMNWTVEAHLLGAVIDALAGLIYVTVKAAGGKAPKPKPFVRPWASVPSGPSSARRGRAPWAVLPALLGGQPGVEVTRHG